MAVNMGKGLLVAQSLLILEGINPFEIPAAPINQSLALFNDKLLIFTIDGYEFTSTSSEIAPTDGKECRLVFVLPKIIDQLIHHTKNFSFAITYFLKNSSYTKAQ